MPTITLYTTNACAYCHMIKKFLTKRGFRYSEINIDEQPERQAEAYKLSGALTVPVTLVERGDQREVIIGFNLSKLIPAIS